MNVVYVLYIVYAGGNLRCIVYVLQALQWALKRKIMFFQRLGTSGILPQPPENGVKTGLPKLRVLSVWSLSAWS